MRDGNLRHLFQVHIPEAHWQSTETPGTGRGVPDLNGCLTGNEFWIEAKVAKFWRCTIRAEQIAWAERRTRAGGRVYLAVRRRRPEADQLWFFNAAGFRAVALDGLRDSRVAPLGVWTGGPARWDWDQVREFLKRPLEPLSFSSAVA